MSGPVDLGDPGSCSVAGGTLRRVADGLETDARAVRQAAGELAGTWTGPAATRGRRRLDEVGAAAASLSGLLATSGAALQAYATTIADLEQEQRVLLGRARAAGLVVGDEVAPARRLRVVDADTEARLAATRTAVEDGLERLGAAAAEARRRLLAELATDAAEELARSVRFGA